MKEEGDANSNDAIDRRHHHSSSSQSSNSSSSSTSTTKSTSKVLASTSISSNSSSKAANNSAKVSSSTNGSGHGPPLGVISSPLRGSRARATASAVDLVRAQIYGNALVTIGTDLVSAAAAAASGLPFTSATSASSEHNRILMQELVANVAARNVSAAVTSVMSSAHNSGSSGSDGSNSASPLLLSSTKTGPKPRAADSPGSGSTTSTTTVSGGLGGGVSAGVGGVSGGAVGSAGVGGGVGSGGGGRDKVFVCQVCNRCFGYKHVLQNHERTHTGEKPFECRECHKRFTRDHHLKTHMRLHTGEKPYHCTHCERQFVQVANLRRHLRVHTGERPYACELCTSKFSDSNQLKAHMLIHKGEKPFECKKCLGRFRRRHHLMHHKCPKDEENIGKPRRGRRPKAYDTLTVQTTVPIQHTSSPSMTSAVSSSTAALAAAATSSKQFQSDINSSAVEFASAVYHRLSSPQSTTTPSHDLEFSSLVSPPIAHSGSRLNDASTVESSSSLVAAITSGSKSRRKPRQTIRILTRETDVTPALLSSVVTSQQSQQTSIQTQPLNLSVSVMSPSLQSVISATRAGHHFALHSSHHRHHHHLLHHHTEDDVLDLSRSRSDDSEAEPIEEEVEDEDVDDDDDDEYEYERQRRLRHDDNDKRTTHRMIAMIGDDSDAEENGTAIPLTTTSSKTTKS